MVAKTLTIEVYVPRWRMRLGQSTDHDCDVRNRASGEVRSCRHFDRQGAGAQVGVSTDVCTTRKK